MPHKPLPEAFTRKKSAILATLAQSQDTYTDKSPKGSVDAPIVDLIQEINAIDGLITTSSCSGRVAVFVEGQSSPTSQFSSTLLDGTDGNGESRDLNSEDAGATEADDGLSASVPSVVENVSKTDKIKTGPGGKGGGKWLFVSHDPVPLKSEDTKKTGNNDNYFMTLCGLSKTPTDHASENIRTSDAPPASSPTSTSNHQYTNHPRRLIRLSFAPLILHILTADLSTHARPLLAAAINAGFRESGVQSLAALHTPQDPTTQSGTMLAIRTAGLTFETVIGQAIQVQDVDGRSVEIMQPLVSEEYLRMCFEVINQRFVWNAQRKMRLTAEIRRAFTQVEGKAGSVWEDREDRRKRKREEGLRIKAEKETALRENVPAMSTQGTIVPAADEDDASGDVLIDSLVILSNEASIS